MTYFNRITTCFHSTAACFHIENEDGHWYVEANVTIEFVPGYYTPATWHHPEEGEDNEINEVKFVEILAVFDEETGDEITIRPWMVKGVKDAVVEYCFDNPTEIFEDLE